MRYIYPVLLCILLLASCRQQSQSTANQDWETERARRIAIDFNRTQEEVKAYIQRYIPDVSDEQIAAWTADGRLESMIIDGQRRYFHNAAPNLFRIDSVACAIKIAKDGNPLSGSEIVNSAHLPAIINAARQEGVDTVLPTRIKVKYTLTVNADAVPDGQTIRCWLPYPRDHMHRQGHVSLIQPTRANCTLSPDTCAHSTLYMEQTAQAGKPTVFSAEYAYTSYAEWHDLDAANILPYDKTSTLYRKYTAERPPHIVFNPDIRQLAQQIVGDETRPLHQARRIFRYVNDNFPWASAREYSTIPCIPQYVLESKHGDCGQVTLLFMTLCRAAGIPTQWQSGFMMHPGAWNLHDWAEIYFEGVGWVPVDQSFGIPSFAHNKQEEWFFLGGIDRWRMIVNTDFSRPLYPPNTFPRSETVDFQRGEVEWKGGNLYFDQWTYDMDITYDDQYANSVNF